MEIMACLVTTVEGVWLLQEAVNKRIPAAVACALVEPSTTAVPVHMMNPKGVSDSVCWYDYSYTGEGEATHGWGGCCE